MLDNYFEYVKTTCEKNENQIHEHNCNLFMFEKKLIKIEKEIKSTSFIKRFFSNEKHEERNSIVEIIQEINSKIRKIKDEEKKLKESAFIHARKKIIENNPSYENKLELLKEESTRSSKVFDEFNNLNNLALESLNNLSNSIKKTNEYYAFTKHMGYNQLGYNITLNDVQHSIYNSLVAASKLKNIIPIVLNKLKKIDNEIDIKNLELVIEKFNENNDIFNITYNTELKQIANQFSKINNALGVLNSIFMLIHEEALKYNEINKTINKNLKLLNDELNAETIITLRINGIDMEKV